MALASNRNASAPVLQRFSQYEAAPRYSVKGKWKNIGKDANIPASNKYDIRGLIDKTSKFGPLTKPCGFSQAKRWVVNREDAVTGGPGQYETARSTITKRDISFGKSQRPEINGTPEKVPGPGAYEVREKNCKGESTLSEVTSKFAGRHGWYYENPEATRKPGPGQYSLVHTQVEMPIGTETKIGTALRPGIETHLGVNSKAPTVGPGHYKHLTTLGGAKVTPYSMVPAYSFTTASYRTKGQKPKDDVEMILQPTQFPKGGFNN